MRRRKKLPPPTEDCPHCGEPVRVGAPACPHCGSDAETGWASSEEIEYQSVEIPDYYTEEDPGLTEIFGMPVRNIGMLVRSKGAWVLALGMALALGAVLRLVLWR